MGSMSLVCPLCCGETFDNSQSLKYHLLSMTDNLYCPNCAERSDSVAALIQHLDCCGESLKPIKVHPVRDYVSTVPGADLAHCGFLAAVNEDGGIVMVGDPRVTGGTKKDEKMDIEEDIGDYDDMLEHLDKRGQAENGKTQTELCEKIIKREKRTSETAEKEMELLEPENNTEGFSPMGIEPFEDRAEEKPDEARLVQVKEEIHEIESDALYSCSSCGLSFNSILSHIKEYHDGQEVVLEMAEQQMNDLPEEAEGQDHGQDQGQDHGQNHEQDHEQDHGQDHGQDEEEEALMERSITSHSRLPNENSSIGSSGAPERSSGGLPRQRQMMNTLRTEECVDSEGRLYTRKVVQIERFWDRGSRAANCGQSQLQQQEYQQSLKSAPMIEKFFSNVEGLKIRTKSPMTMTAAVATTAMIPTTMTTTTTNTTTTTTTTSTTSTTTSTTSTSSSHASVHLRMYRCNKCLEQFAKLADFRVHACIHGNNQCDLCEQAFASTKALQLHSRIHEAEAEGGNDSNFVCQTCGTEFSSHKSLRLHSRMHAPVRARHVDAPEGTNTANFTCLECGKTLSESYRKAHMALHKGDSATCSVCNRKFDSADSLAMHAAVHIEFAQSQQHKQAQMQSLDGQTIEDDANGGGGKCLKGAKKADKGAQGGDASEKPYQCQHCGRRFTRPHEKVKHERIHTGEKPHACEVCGKTFRVSYCLTLHMRTHTGVRPYACQHCGKRFKASSVYNHHLLTHGEERAYTCPYCPKTFKTRVQLAGHKNSHTKPFRCTECSRPFASLYAARAHIQTHKKDNNLKFSCYICGASYGRAFALKDHLKQHAGQDILVPPPEPSHEEEVADADDFLITDEYEEVEEIEEIEEIEEEEHKLVAIAAAAAAHVDVHHSTLVGGHDRPE